MEDIATLTTKCVIQLAL